MKSFIHEMGIVDITGKVHSVKFKEGLNVVTGKSSTGKSALIEIFDYCFASDEYTVPKGVITDNASVYFVYLNVNEQSYVLGRLPEAETAKKAFFKREDDYETQKISRAYFDESHFIPLDKYKTHVRSLFLDIEDVDESLIAKEQRPNAKKAPTPSIRSFTSFMLQHQNLIANKHALFYRFDEKIKRDQVIEHTKIFLGLVDQNFFNLQQEKERLQIELKSIEREKLSNSRAVERQRQNITPVLEQLYSAMGLSEIPVSAFDILNHPQDAKERLDKVIAPEKIVPLSDAITQHHIKLQQELAGKTAELRRLQREAGSINKHISEGEALISNGERPDLDQTLSIAKSVCPFCQSEHEHLHESAELLKVAILKLSQNLRQAKPMKARFQSLLLKVQREMESLSNEISKISRQISEIERSEKILQEKKSLHESILVYKARLDMLIDTITFVNEPELEARLKAIEERLKKIESQLNKYDFRRGLNEANLIINHYMSEIGKHFDFEESYKPINLNFSFETFDLYHLNSRGEKIFLRSMGSGANWLYCHVTLFLALHKYFASLGEKCSIPSILFLDQPTQVYFPSFRFDKSSSFDKEAIQEIEERSETERTVDEDIEAVENLFSRISIYCSEIKDDYGFTPQIIVTDHADDLKLSDETSFELLVNGNRWRDKGFIDPIPKT